MSPGNDCCYVGLQQELDRIANLKRKQAEKRCFAVAKEIYKFLEAHPRSALHDKKITIHVNLDRVEAKQFETEEKE